MTRVGFIALLGVVLACGPLGAEEDAVTVDARAVVISYKDRGYTNIRSEKSGPFNGKNQAAFTATLYEGESYLAVAATASLADSLDIYVLDADMKKMDLHNERSGRQAAVFLTPRKTGKYVFYLSAKGASDLSYKFYLVSRRPDWLK